MALTLILIIGHPIPYRKQIWMVALTALLLTYARSAYVAYFAGDWVWGGLTKDLKMSFYRTLLVVMLIMVLPRPAGEGVRLERINSIEARAKSVVTAWDIFVDKPLFGIGFNAYRKYSQPDTENWVRPVHPSAPDNSYLFILVTAGVMGILAFLLLAGFLLKFTWGQPVLMASLAIVGTASLTNNALFYPMVLVWLGMLLSSIAQTTDKI